MTKPKKKAYKKTTKKKRVTRKRAVAKSQTQPALNSSPALPNLNQIAPKLNFKIVGTPILPGLKNQG